MNLNLSTLTVALALGLGSLQGCGVPGETDTSETGGGPTQSGLSFEDTGTLQLTPGESRDVTVRAPAGSTVRFLLLGQTSDASVSPAELEIDGSGEGTVLLTAPTSTSTFVLLAQAGEASAELSVAVSEQGFLSLRVVPEYNGMRTLSEPWTADVLVGGDCTGLLATYPQEPIGELSSTAAIGENPVVDSVPVGALLAVGLRSGKLVAGCAVLDPMSAKEEQEIVVTVNDQPMVLGGASMVLTLGFSAEPSAYGDIVTTGVETVAELAFPSETSTAQILLNEMVAGLEPNAGQSLASLIETANLKPNVEVAMDGFDARQFCLDLSDSARALALAELGSGSSEIKAKITGTDGSPGVAAVEMETFLGLGSDVAKAGPLDFAWLDTGNDSLVITGTIPLSGARLSASYMNAVVADELGAVSVAEALRGGVDCAAVASTIVSSGEVDACGLDCLEDACEMAIDARWAAGLLADDVDDLPLSKLEIAASGSVKVDQDVAPAELTGTWSGTLTALGTAAPAHGEATGSPATPE